MKDHKIKFVFNKEFSNDLHGVDKTSFYNVLNGLGLIEKPYFSDNLPEDIFVFEYQQIWQIPTEEYFGDFGFLERVPCPKNVLDRIKNKTALLIITVPFESPVQNFHLEKIHAYISKLNLPSSQIIYQTCCLNAKELYEDFCKEINDTPKFNMEYTSLNISMHNYLIETNKNITNVEYVKEKTFLMFNRRWLSHPHRTLFLYHAYKNKLLDDFYMSFSKTDVDHNANYSTVVGGHWGNFSDDPIDENILIEIEKRLPLILDTEDLVTSSLMFEQFETTRQFYEKSFISIVSETYFDNNILHLTEKTFKPMIYKHPFIILGPSNFLLKLKELGFKTFDNVWDESYDQTHDHRERFHRIIQLVESISKKTFEEKKELLVKCLPSIEHNFNLLKNFKANKLVVNDILNKYKLI
jgi:hypothetical protein